jgi:hypothetical protein
MGIVMGVTTVIVAIAAGIVGLLVWTALLFPQPTARARMALVVRPVRCGLTGLGVTLLLGIPAFGLLQAPHGGAKLAGWALALPLAAVLVVGFAAMAQLLGERMQGLSPAITPLAALVRGAVTIELAALLPFVGWFLFAPLVGLTLVGAGARGCFLRDPAKKEPQRHRDHEADELESQGEVNEREITPLAPLPLSLLVGLCVSVSLW